MTEAGTRVLAVGLLSGGLDSGLAVRVLLDLGIRVLGVSFTSPFFGPEKGRRMAEQLGIPWQAVDITRPHLDLVKAPPHGYGNNMNPCIDCHALMLARAGEVMREAGGRFLFTGEVLNQRPMSQNARSLALVEKASGMEGFVLRPLSARLLPETPVEREGVVDRSRLLALSGRSRKAQIELAARWGIRDYPAPAGGCLLTDPGFSARLRDLFLQQPGAGAGEIERLKHGRHFRLPGGGRAMVGRNQADNEALERLAGPGDLVLTFSPGPGPLTLVAPPFDEEGVRLAASLAAAHGRAGGGGERGEVEIAVRPGGCPAPEAAGRTLRAAPLPREEVDRLRIA